jgi:urea carboxylase
MPRGFDVITPGAFTTVQDFPGRTTIGDSVPRSEPMDNVSSRVANILVGNDSGMELLEMTISGPELLFAAPAVFSVCGAPVSGTVTYKGGIYSETIILFLPQRLRN